MIRIRIGIDIDGCVYPWTRAANEALMARFGIEDPGEHEHWDYLEEIVGPGKFSWLWTSEAADMVFGRLDLIFPGACDVVNALAEEHEVHFVTHRNPYRTAEVTGRWLKFWFRNYAGVHTLTNKSPKHLLGKWDVFIDDKPSTVINFVDKTDSLVLMPERLYNSSVDSMPCRTFLQYVGARENFRAFGHWGEVEGLINAEVERGVLA